MRLIAICCLLLLAAAPVGAQVNHASYDDIVERGWLEIAVYEDFPPFSYRDGAELKGVDVEPGRLIAEGLGVRAVFREQAADETVDDDLRNTIWKGHYLGGGVADLMMHVPYDREFALRNGQVVSAANYLPLSTAEELPPEWGTRHRAAMGLIEKSDAWTIVVSEERGDVALARNKMIGGIEDAASLKKVKRNTMELV